MRIFTSSCAVFILTLFTSLQVLAGPFGTEMGDPLEKFQNPEEIKPSIYTVNDVPQKFSLFEQYMLYCHPATGLAAIRGISFTFKNDAYGFNVREKFKELKTIIDKKYGKSKTYDFLAHGSMWKESKEWAMAISINQRHYSAIWNITTGASLSDNIKEITISAKATSSESTYITIHYEYNVFEKYKETVKNAESDSL